MIFFEITPRGSRYCHSPYLERTLDVKILDYLDKKTSANKEQIINYTGANDSDVSGALLRLQHANPPFVVGR